MKNYFLNGTSAADRPISRTSNVSQASTNSIVNSSSSGKMTTTSRMSNSNKEKSYSTMPSKPTAVESAKGNMDSAINSYSNKTTVVIRRYGIR
jgi:hypothetical protein